MQDFLKLILKETKGAIALALLGVVGCAIVVSIVYAFYKRKDKRETSFPWKRTLLITFSIAYLFVLLYATLMRTSGGSGTSFYLFRAWREAWNTFSLQSWLNIFLNILLFMPLGVLLPCWWKAFHKWYFMLGVGVLSSLLIETMQLILHRGIFDIDDLSINTLGCMVAYCIYKIILTFTSIRKKMLHRVAYAILPLVTLISISSIFIAYRVQDYGNLPNAPTFRISTKGMEWEQKCSLNTEPMVVSMYQASGFTREQCDDFGREFFKKLGVTKEIDIVYYDQESYFSDHEHHTLTVSYKDGSYIYRYRSEKEFETGVIARAELEKILEGYGILIPQDTILFIEGEGRYIFESSSTPSDGNFTSGKIVCTYSAQGEITQIINTLTRCSYYDDAEILSQYEAFEELKKGNFYWVPWGFSDSKKIDVLSCSLLYEIDTKGFYQPVYAFAVLIDNQTEAEFRVPALK